MQIVTPVFAGYLISATLYVIGSTRGRARIGKERQALLGIVLAGVVAGMSLIGVTMLVVFGYRNRASGMPGIGMRVDDLTDGFTFLMAILGGVLGIFATELYADRS